MSQSACLWAGLKQEGANSSNLHVLERLAVQRRVLVNDVGDVKAGRHGRRAVCFHRRALPATKALLLLAMYWIAFAIHVARTLHKWSCSNL